MLSPKVSESELPSREEPTITSDDFCSLAGETDSLAVVCLTAKETSPSLTSAVAGATLSAELSSWSTLSYHQKGGEIG